MDTLTSPNANIGSVNRYYFNLAEDDVSIGERQKNTVIKYTKLPDFDVGTQVSGQPRFRRIISVDEPQYTTSRSMVSGYPASSQNMMTRTSNRKIINITNDEGEYNTRLGTRRLSSRKPLLYEEKQKSVSKLSEMSKYSYNGTSSSKSVIVNKIRLNEINRVNTKKSLGNCQLEPEKKNRNTMHSHKNTTVPKTQSNVDNIAESVKEISYLKKSVKSNYNKKLSNKRVADQVKKKTSMLNQVTEETTSNKQVSIIALHFKEELNKESPNTNDSEIDGKIKYEDAIIETDPIPEKIDQSTETEYELGIITNCKVDKSCSYDSLDIPNVTLTKEKCDLPKEEGFDLMKASLPNLNIPTVRVVSQNNQSNVNDSLLYKSPSYIIGRATVTYTTHQEINFHVMSSNDDSYSNFRSSPLVYPYSVVSVLKQELCSQTPMEVSKSNKFLRARLDKRSIEENKEKLCNDSYFLSSRQLVKPSEIISTLNVNSSFLQNDFICEQFQRELNFIDSFFESLQYLENCFLTEKCLDTCNSELWAQNSAFNQNSEDYNNVLSKLETIDTVAGKETMASKSLYLLNLLIRDEQRRAKNLLMVLKMREDALKDFTKSQIIWLENKKKQENTDISTLKKKQRGALVKLQHECGEMQRMRKALRTLSDKRKAALMKTKKNIELKLNNNVDVEQILLEKKKNKRPVTDRHVAPVKCFDLSSSGCDETSILRLKPEKIVHSKEICSVSNNEIVSVKTSESVEKSIQTGDSILESLNDGVETSENNVVVDGGYLNILFQSHALPQIFSSGKQYEVNEEALRNIVNSSNQKNKKLSDSDVFDKFMDQLKNHESEQSTSPSTARSLVDEFDQYYKDLEEEDYFPITSSAKKYVNPEFDTKDHPTQAAEHAVEFETLKSCEVTINMSVISVEEQFDAYNVLSSLEAGLEILDSQTGPLPTPVGAPQVTELTDSASWIPLKFTESDANVSDSASLSAPGISSVSSSAYEAEELRKQQLAIEKEIKALEQQQCQLLVVREIPDKPPPPYTPPTETKPVKPPRLFLLDENTKDTIRGHITSNAAPPRESDALDMFLSDYCSEVLKRQRLDISDKPWDSCNLQPQKQELNSEKLVNKAYDDLQEIISGISPSNATGVGRERRSDHIDDILFAEWRRCEPEWTALHSDEATVKNQIFENIFQRILSETVVEYKKTLHNNLPSDSQINR